MTFLEMSVHLHGLHFNPLAKALLHLFATLCISANVFVVSVGPRARPAAVGTAAVAATPLFGSGYHVRERVGQRQGAAREGRLDEQGGRRDE